MTDPKGDARVQVPPIILNDIYRSARTRLNTFIIINKHCKKYWTLETTQYMPSNRFSQLTFKLVDKYGQCSITMIPKHVQYLIVIRIFRQR